MWKARFNHIWSNANHLLLCPDARPDKLFWKLSCSAIDKQTALWKQQDSMEKLIDVSDADTQFGPVLLENGTTCIAYSTTSDLMYGHQEYSLVYWKLSSDEKPFDEMRSLFATGSSWGTIYVFDSRLRNKPKYQYQPHTGYVAKLAMNTEYILSASEDKTVSVWDQRAGRTMKSITIPDEATPTCMSMRRDNWVCVGDTKAKLHMLNPKNNFELVKSYSTEHTDSIRGVRLTHGCRITSSKGGIVRISSPTDPPKLIATLRTGYGNINSMDYLNDTLAIVSGQSLGVWRPKSTCLTKHH
ncbi:F-box/WD repeat-containing protein 9-like isoform X2 [Temnothorax longispinosus]|uniref:F-box/WD repeat-containing protein 9-like isoform X2 n=1 Tax=Temnothorax longispinosus TaxID=300112 RepID=UPI003A998348